MGKAPVDDIKKLIVIKVKARQDSYSDQYTRLFMVRVFMLTALITSITWVKDRVNCLVPKTHELNGGYVSQACWINGVYVLRDVPYGNQSFYYGIPDDFSLDGINPYGGLCATFTAGGNAATNCTPLKKSFFLQYQWFPAVAALIGLLYYLPYLLFKIVNADMRSLKSALKGDSANCQTVVDRFFNYQQNPVNRLHARVAMNLGIKVLYILANIFGFLLINACFSGWVVSYGRKYAAWAGLSNEAAHTYFGMRQSVKPGHEMLPGFAICEVMEEALDIKFSVVNRHKFICEMSQHVLYQYMLIVLWYCMVFGIAVSILGFISHILNHFFNLYCVVKMRGTMAHDVYKHLTLRECQYLEYVRHKNLPVYGDLIRALNEKRVKEQGGRGPSGSYDMKSKYDE